MDVVVDAVAQLRALLRVPMANSVQQQVQGNARSVAQELATRGNGARELLELLPDLVGEGGGAGEATEVSA